MNYETLSKEVMAITEKAINVSLDALSENAFFSPYILYGKEGNKIERLQVDDIDEIIEIAEEFIEEIEDGSTEVVLCYQDSVTLKDGVFDAIITQIYSSDEDHGYSFGQLYKIENDKLQLLNKKIFLGNIRNCLIF